MRKIFKSNFLILLLFAFTFQAYANDQNKAIVFSIDLKKNVSSTTWLYIQKGFAEAESLGAENIIIEMNTYGGEVNFADSIRTKILNSEVPVWVFIDNNAASAGALISIACDKIYMRRGATIGAATVVDQTGQKLPDKYQSYMRATMRATAEAKGKVAVVNGNDTTYRWKRDPLIAEAMVDERTVIENVTDSGKVLTFTTNEAIEHNYCDGTAENIREIIKQELNEKPYELVKFQPTTWDNIKGFMTSPIFQSILIMLIIGGIYFELQTPGVGFSLIVAITAAVLYFAPLYIDGLAEHWEILLFFIGIALILIEIFAIPGFGFVGISGIILVVVGLALSLIDNFRFDFKHVQATDTITAFLTVSGGLLMSFGAIIYLTSKIGSKGLLNKMALHTTLDNKDGYIGVPIEEAQVIGETGLVTTDLRPSGKVRINKKSYDAISENNDFIEKGNSVKVVRYEAGQVYVEKL